MIRSKSIILFFAIVFSCICATAQTGNKYVYQDSSVISDEEAPPPVVGLQRAADSSIEENSLELSPDSIKQLQNSGDYPYMKDLGSRLRNLRKKMQESPNSTRVSMKAGGGFFSSSAMQFILWGIAGAFVLFILYKIFSTSTIFSKTTRVSKVNEIAEESDQNYIANYLQGVAQALRDRNYRLAARFSYLHVLQRLSDKGLVKTEAGKTNYQYIRELTDTAFKDDFSAITRYYEYVWYGEFELNEDAFSRFQHQCQQFNNRI